VYARADPKKSLERVKKRARSGESGMSLAYLEACHAKHEAWIMDVANSSQTIIFDANKEFVGDQKHRVEELVDSLNKFIL
jgi:deoxyadenosine/deoxycytidine kinase